MVRIQGRLSELSHLFKLPSGEEISKQCFKSLQQGEEMVYLPGKCCPECMTTTSFCVYKEKVKEVNGFQPNRKVLLVCLLLLFLRTDHEAQLSSVLSD